MAEGKIRVKFEAVGAPELIAAIKALNTQTKRLGTEQQRTSTTTAKLNTQQERQVRNQNLLNASFFLKKSYFLSSYPRYNRFSS